MPWNDLSPWEQMRYFTAPTESVITLGPTAALVVPGNPYRRSLIFYGGNAANATVATSLAALAAGGGMAVSPLLNPLQLMETDHGSLIQLPWYATGSGKLGVIQTVLISWPDEAPLTGYAAGGIAGLSPSDPWPDPMAMAWRRSKTFNGSPVSMPSAAEVDAMFAGVKR